MAMPGTETARQWHRPHSFPQSLVAGCCARSDDDECDASRALQSEV